MIPVVVVERYRSRIRTRVPIGIAPRPDIQESGLPETPGTDEIRIDCREVRRRPLPNEEIIERRFVRRSELGRGVRNP